jgi:hypothetical protein
MGLRGYVTPANVITTTFYWKPQVILLVELIYLFLKLFLQLCGTL